MGGDGGVKATQRKYLRGAKNDDAHDDQKHVKRNQVLRTRICTQSAEPLREPIVCCELGNLYSKEAIITALLNKSVIPSCAHVRGLKDIKVLKFSPNPNTTEQQLQATGDETQPSKYICPITKQEFNGLQPFVAIWTTGFVLSERAIKQMGIEALQEEYGPFSAEDVIKLAPNEAQMDELRATMVSKRNKLKAEKASRKVEKISATVATEGGEGRKRKHNKTVAASTATGSVVDDTRAGKRISQASNLVKSAASAVVEQQSSSSVFKKLFHKDKAKDQEDRDLFMSGVGLRYSIS